MTYIGKEKKASSGEFRRGRLIPDRGKTTKRLRGGEILSPGRTFGGVLRKEAATGNCGRAREKSVFKTIVFGRESFLRKLSRARSS